VSWESWAERFTAQGFDVWTPGWPNEPRTVGDARQRPEALKGLGLDAISHHYGRLVRSFDTPPVLIGHGVGGLVAQRLIGESLGRAAVVIAPAPINNVPLPASQARLCPAANEAVGDVGTVFLSPEQFKYVVANTVGIEESSRLYQQYAVPAPRRLLTDLGYGGDTHHPRVLVDTGNTGRGPLLIISGQEDRLVPDSVTRAVYELYGDSTAVSDLKQFADRGHCLVIDSGWRTVADYVLAWLAGHGVSAKCSAR
jgi:pimeloyl-ACP methyl ester carboxylesterase